MKLKNILVALSLLFAFSACSSDDGNKNGEKKAKATISVRVATKASTKADDPHALVGEAMINNLTALVFDETGSKLLGIKQETPNANGEHTLSGIPSEEAVRVKFVLIANAPLSDLSQVTNYTELEELLAELAAQKQDYLTMSTQVITTAQPLNEGDNNYIGFGNEQTNINGIGNLLLTRVPARLDVVKIQTTFTKPILLGRKVLIEEIFYENAKNLSYFFSEADWGQVEYNSGEAYTRSTQMWPNEFVSNGNPIENIGYVAYTMENFNEERPTRLVVKATLDGTDKYLPETKYFRAVINANGKKKGYDHDLVKRNYIYSADLTFSDSSFDGDKTEPDPEPEESYLDVQVTVASWRTVTQDVDIDE